jgi:hypothetical protein
MFIDLGQLGGIQKAWKTSKKPTKLFVEYIVKTYPNLVLGGTFIPEKLLHFGYTNDQILEVFDWVVQTLNMKHIRLGMRIGDMNLDKKSLGIYGDILSYGFDNDVQFTLNIGPVKFCGYPEYHIPQYITDRCEVPEFGGKVTCRSEFSQSMMTDLKRVFELLKKTYTTSELSQIAMLQPENESFNKFGSKNWSFDDEHLIEIANMCGEYFPDTKLLFNSAGLFDIPELLTLAGSGNISQKMVIGLDYYYQIGDMGKHRWLKALDLFVASNRKGNYGLGKVKQLQKQYGFQTEVTEAQMEPWGRSSEPGNSVRSLKYVVLRASQWLDPMSQNQVIRLWGVEELAMHGYAGSLSEEHKKMIDLIKLINKGLFLI